MKLTAESTVFNDDKVQEKFAELIVDADGIRTEVGKKTDKSSIISTIRQSAERVKIQADKVDIEGAAIFTGSGRLSETSLDNAYDANGAATGAVNTLKNDLASASGTTTINGGHIVTGTLDADAVNASSGTFNTANIPNLSAEKITVGSQTLTTALNGKAASGAENTANNYITDVTSTDGIRVHDSHTSNNSIVINSDGMEVFKGGTTDAYSVAKYGDTARIGKEAGSHVVTSDTQFAMLTNVDEPYFSVTHNGSTDTQRYWQTSNYLAANASGFVGTFPLKNTSSSVRIHYEYNNDGDYYPILVGTITNANVRTANYSTSFTVKDADGDSIGTVVVTCTQTTGSPYVTINAKNSTSSQTRISMEYRRTTYRPIMRFTGDNPILWEGELEMNDMDTITLTEPVSQQVSGICLVWAKTGFQAPVIQYVPKTLVRLRGRSGDGLCVNQMMVQSGFSNVGTKTVYILEETKEGGVTTITGHSANAQSSGSGSSISPNHSNLWNLFYVFGI